MDAVKGQILDVDDDRDDAPPTTLMLRSPEVPTTLGQLAALKGEAIEIIEARVQVIATLRTASIRATHPEDWLLFKSPDERVIGYLQDAGCDRVRDLWGIEVYDISRPEKVAGAEPAVFHYLITGSGRCKLTRQTVEAMEGGRSSTDDFCRGKTGADLELAVRKAARANLDGNVTRELAGMKSVPLDEIELAWAATNKKIAHCRQGRGFGTGDERVGATRAGVPDVPPPICPHCHTKGVYRPAKNNRGAFYGCPQYATHPDQKFIIDAAKWEKEQLAGAAPAAATPREPGAEG